MEISDSGSSCHRLRDTPYIELVPHACTYLRSRVQIVRAYFRGGLAGWSTIHGIWGLDSSSRSRVLREAYTHTNGTTASRVRERAYWFLMTARVNVDFCARGLPTRRSRDTISHGRILQIYILIQPLAKTKLPMYATEFMVVSERNFIAFFSRNVSIIFENWSRHF